MERGMRAAMRSQMTMRNRRQGDIQMQDQALMREDLGFKMTGAQYEDYLSNEAKYQKDYSDYEAKLRKSEGGLEEYNKQLSGIEAQLAQAIGVNQQSNPENIWKKYEGGFKNVRVYDGNELQGVYRLPKEAVDDLNSSTFNQGDGSYVGNWKSENDYNVDVTMRGGEKYGKELHEALGNAQSSVRDTFFGGYDDEITREDQLGDYYKFIEERAGKAPEGEDEEYNTKLSAALNEWYNTGSKQGAHHKGAGEMITEKQKEAAKMLTKQRDILAAKRAEFEAGKAQQLARRKELEDAQRARDEQKQHYKQKHEESVASRKNLFALRGK